MGRVVFVSFNAKEAGELAESLYGKPGVAADLRATLLDSLENGWLGGIARSVAPSVPSDQETK